MRAATKPVELRPADQVMKLARIGAFHQTQLSFTRTLLRRAKAEKWQFARTMWEIDNSGEGVAVFQAKKADRTYSLITFAHDLPADMRTDRVIATAWDATFVLFDGTPDRDDIQRLSQNVPKQEAGRVSQKELVLSRANRSVRMFDYIVDCLAQGQQPDAQTLQETGYLMRTTAVYGSGKFGAADYDVWRDRPEFQGSFQPEMLSVWLVRWFALDLVEHLAKCKDSTHAVPLRADLRTQLGIGNSTGLGMAPFLINHPKLINSWIYAREAALMRVRNHPHQQALDWGRFVSLLERAKENCRHWHTTHQAQTEKLVTLCDDLAHISAYCTNPMEFNQLYMWVEQNCDLEAQELIVSLLIDTMPQLSQDLTTTMCDNSPTYHKIDPSLTISQLIETLENSYGWVNDIDFSTQDSDARVWYVSQEKLEPRLGERYQEPIADYEQPLSPARDVHRLWQDLRQVSDNSTIGEFLNQYSEHRHIIRRILTIQNLPYAEIRDNTIDAKMLPIDLLRCKLSFFGATKFDPRSDRWVRINLFQGAPMPWELATSDLDNAAYPTMPAST